MARRYTPNQEQEVLRELAALVAERAASLPPASEWRGYLLRFSRILGRAAHRRPLRPVPAPNTEGGA